MAWAARERGCAAGSLAGTQGQGDDEEMVELPISVPHETGPLFR